jgi:hypothetical protein
VHALWPNHFIDGKYQSCHAIRSRISTTAELAVYMVQSNIHLKMFNESNEMSSKAPISAILHKFHFPAITQKTHDKPKQKNVKAVHHKIRRWRLVRSQRHTKSSQKFFTPHHHKAAAEAAAALQQPWSAELLSHGAPTAEHQSIEMEDDRERRRCTLLLMQMATGQWA